MARGHKGHNEFNPARFDSATGKYYSAIGCFETLSSAYAARWICRICNKAFEHKGELHEHRDIVHSY